MLTPDSESVSWLRFAFASATVIALMGALAWGLKYVTLRGWIVAKSQDKRIQVTASLTLDARRRLVLVKCDETEHLLLLGPSGDLQLSQNAKPDRSTP